jgi:hypothetical protein
MPSLFARFRRHRPTVEDAVWPDQGRRIIGLLRQVRAAADQGNAVLVVVRDSADLALLLQGLAAKPLAMAEQGWALEDLRRALATPGGIGLTLAGLPARDGRELQVGHRVHAHVMRRATRRVDDASLLEALSDWKIASVTFHNALDDPLLQPHTAAVRALIGMLDAESGEPVQGAMISRAIEKAQRG